MMDLYDAIEEVEHYLKYGAGRRMPTKTEEEAIRICMEAAKDKGGV